MRKALRKISLAVATLLCSTIAASAAEATVLYDKASGSWTDADLGENEWVVSGTPSSTTVSETGITQVGRNTAFAITKSIAFTENSIVTLTATIHGGNAPGRNTSYDYIKIGAVTLHLNGQDKIATVEINGVETSLTGYTRDSDFSLTVTIDQASGKISGSVSGGTKGNFEGTDNTALSGVEIGHFRGGSEGGWDNSIITKSVKVTEEVQEVKTADYTINYKLGENIVKTETGNSVVGVSVEAKAPFTVEDQKYYFAEGAQTSLTLAEDASANVLDVAVRKAYEYNYTIKNNVNSETITGVCVEGEEATVPFKQYLLVDGTLYEKAAINNQYNLTIAPTADNYEETIQYSATDITGVVYFSEAEEIEGMTATGSSNANIRCSNSLGGYSDAAVTATTLPAGKYKVTVQVWGNAGATITVKAGDDFSFGTETAGYRLAATSNEFTINKETTVTIEGTESSKPLDWIYIQKTGDVEAVEPTVIYERTSESWVETDLGENEWVISGTPTSTAVDENGITQSGQNQAFAVAKDLEFTEYSIITLSATIHGGNAPGRNTSYDYIKIGGVTLKLFGQDKKATIAIGDDETALSGYTRDADYTLTVTIDQATGKVSGSVSGGTSGTFEGRSNEAVTGVEIGHFRGGSEGSWANTIVTKSIKVTEELQDVTIVDYTINYKLGENIVKSDNGQSIVGADVEAKAPFTEEGQKYYFAEGAETSMTLGEDASENVLNVAVRKAYEYNYTIKNNVNDQVITGVCVEEEQVKVPFRQYILADGTLYEKAAINNEYNLTIAPTADNYEEALEYSASEITGVVYFSEAEEIDGMTATGSSNADIRCSNALGGYSEEAVTATTLPAGKYKVSVQVWGNAGATITVKAGSALDFATETTGSRASATSEEFTVYGDTPVTIEGTESSKPLDWIYIQKTGDIELADAPKLYINNEEVTENVIKDVLSTEVTFDTPAEGDYIWYKLTAKTEEATAAEGFEKLEGNSLTLTADHTRLDFYLGDENGYRKSEMASYTIEGVVTGLSNIAAEEATADKWYNLQGIEIAEPTQAGVYIHNGKKVVVK